MRSALTTAASPDDAGALFALISDLAGRPEPFGTYCSPLLWNDPHISSHMLAAHLDPTTDRASIPASRIGQCVESMVDRLGIGPGTRLCDFGCGPGLWTTRFAEAGADVTGIDLSERSILYARKAAAERGIDVQYVLADYLQFATDERFDVLTMIHGDFSVLSPQQAERMLGLFAAILVRGGIVALDVASPAAYSAASEQRLVHAWYPEGGFFSPNPYHEFRSTFLYADRQLVADRYTVVEAARVLDLIVWNQCYDLAALRDLLGLHGFTVRGAYGDFAGADLKEKNPRIAVVAERTA